jgi:integrase
MGIEWKPYYSKDVWEKGRIIDITINLISTRFARICKKLEIENVTFHCLRHYYVSKLHYAGYSDLFIQETGGWKSDYVMKKVYRNVIDEEQKK